jgi:poly-gamma-glutamate capsule biosynthesis protein CapA/YwtB (metallophosphatase superfamily)
MLLTASLFLATAPWTLVLGGDIMLNSVRPSSAVWEGVAPVVRAADLSMANLEIPLTRATTRTDRKTEADIKARNQYVLKADPDHAPHLAAAGWRVVSLANNHTMDFGAAGLEETLGLLRRHRIAYAGAGSTAADAQEPVVVTLPNGLRVGMISAMAFVTRDALLKTMPATDRSPGVAVLSFGGVINARARAKVQSWVAGAKGRCDFLVVGLHWGLERQTIPTAYQVALGRAFADAGADVVWGHHAHVLQGAEVYRGKPILYSTGNLVSALPGDTALFRLRFEGSAMTQFEVLPARIEGGKVAFVPEARRPQALEAFRKLNESLARQHPNAQSRPPTF